MKILILCTYPINDPRHGGQLRVRNIVDSYRAAGHFVQIVGVLGSDQYSQEDGFLPFPGHATLAKVLPNPFLMEDYAIGRWFADDDKAYRRLASLVQIDPDVIQVEQPWLFGFAWRYIREHSEDAQLIYSSQNIEWRLKQEIISSYRGLDAADECAGLVKTVEQFAIERADAVVAVSEMDAASISTLTSKPVLLAPNGVKPWQVTDRGLAQANAIAQGRKYALYCASSHPPNVTGFFGIFGDGIGSLKPDEHLIVAGAAGWAITADPRFQRAPKLAERVIATGMVNQECLEGLLDMAHCLILPLTQGGGTNLKTAEALWAGKHIVSTSVAMRGFEQFIGSSGVIVEDEPGAFKRALRLAMEREPLKLSQEDIRIRRSVLWEQCLKPLVDFISTL